MRYIIISLFLTVTLFASLAKTVLISVDTAKHQASVKIAKIDLGMSGFIVHTIDAEHTSILKNAQVIAYNKETSIATLSYTDFNYFENSYLPHGKWQVRSGDVFEFAGDYSRALLIAPTDEIYHKITKSVTIQWIHPDIFASILSYNGHPTPQESDFKLMNKDLNVGLLFLYINQNIYTVDIKSFKILSISKADLVQKDAQLPFYSRIKKITANWFGKGSSRLEAYAPYYYELLIIHNKTNAKLYEIVKNEKKEISFLLEKFDIGK